jgi:hypothetical protein
MKNADKPINPIFDQQGFISHQSTLEIGNHETLHGLTKREYFAAMAMQGLLSNSNWMQEYQKEKYLMTDNVVAEVSTQYAEALLNQLEK